MERKCRNRLMVYRDNERYLENQMQRLEVLKSKMYAVTVPELTDMPKAPSVVQDKIGKMVALKEEIEQDIARMIEHQNEEKKWIRETLEKNANSDEKSVIQMRYIDSESWNKIVKALYGKKEDFLFKKEKYVKRCMRTHKSALKKMSQASENN